MMITGDYGLTAESIARQVGIVSEGPVTVVDAGDLEGDVAAEGLGEVLASGPGDLRAGHSRAQASRRDGAAGHGRGGRGHRRRGERCARRSSAQTSGSRWGSPEPTSRARRPT